MYDKSIHDKDVSPLKNKLIEMCNAFKLLIISFLLVSCAGKKKLETARDMSVDIYLPTDYVSESITLPDTLARYTDNEGIEHTIGHNTLDEKTGEQLLTVGLQEVKVTARFKNVAERGGAVQLAFNIQVPPELQNDNWELYMSPVASVMNDSITLQGISLVGENFRKKQERQYEYYNELCKVIIPENDLNQFLNRRELEKSIARHNREVLRQAKLSYRRSLKSENFKIQTSEDTAVFVSKYMNSAKVNRNEYFKRVLANQFDRIVTLKKRDNLQADRIADPDSIYNYAYQAEIPATDATGRIKISMRAEIRSLNGDCYPVRMSDSLSFVVSSLRNFVKEKAASDQEYDRALTSLKNGNYRDAVEVLRPYADENTVVAYLALGYDQMAYNLLQSLPATSDNLYLKSISASRLKKEKEAVELYSRSCAIDKSKVWRGNLDPEISSLIKKYGLNEL